MDLESVPILLCELCRGFYSLGWVSGTGGSISIKQDGLIYMSPSGVQKERMVPEDIFVLDSEGNVIKRGVNPLRTLRLSQCFPLFMAAYNRCDAGAVIHTHSVNACMVTMAFEREFICTHLEMIKGIEGLGFTDRLIVPIIENTSHERDLEQSLVMAMEMYPKATAVLVRRHGVYVWGKDWVSAKSQAECYDYLFQVSLQMISMGIRPENASSHLTLDTTVKAVLLDIEGTTTSVRFVKETLFPFAQSHFRQFLEDHMEDPAVLLQCSKLVKEIKGSFTTGSETIDEICEISFQLMKSDLKSTPLKALQGMIWEGGYSSGELVGHLYDDVAPAIESWTRRGIAVYVYSSGSVDAQKLLFSHSTVGDLSSSISGYFDTTSGHKREFESYTLIAQEMRVEPFRILFLTDTIEEALAASAVHMRLLFLYYSFCRNGDTETT